MSAWYVISFKLPQGFGRGAVQVALLTKSWQHRLNLSSALHDIDLAVERGRTAPELSPAQDKKAELANLELLVARVSDRSCSRSDAGGALGQLKEFNAFLERAAVALEGR